MKRYKQNRSKFQPFTSKRVERKIRNRFILSLLLALVLIYFLFTWLIPNLIGQLRVINRFKPDLNQKKHLLENASLAPPVLNIPYEATNTAVIKISGFAQPRTKVEIYIDDNLQTTVDTKDDGAFLAENIQLLLELNNINAKTVDEKGGKSLPSKTIRIIYDNQKPKLELSKPEDNQVIKDGDKKITILGNTEPGNDIWVSGVKIVVNSEGSFNQTIGINDGENDLIIQATDKAGNTTSLSRKVIYQP